MDTFFDQSTDQSRVKAAIVANYFWAWAKVIISVAKKGRDRRIAYIDLFAGPGRYTDGTTSTPLLILERAIADPDLRETLVTVFNDGNSDHSKTLESAIASIPGITTLKYKPQVNNSEVGEEIYVNGSNNLENLKAPDDTWKVRLIEEDFHRLMFETED